MYRRRVLGGLFLVGVGTALGGTARAQGSLPDAPLIVGEKYVGVSPSTATPNPLPRAGREPNHLIWSGVERAGDGLRVFFQTTGQVVFELVGGKAGKPSGSDSGASGGDVSVLLRNCRIHLRNNGRRLDTRFFPGPVASVTAQQRRRDVELRIALKEPVQPATRIEPGPDGTFFLVVEFQPAAAAAVNRVETSPPAADLAPGPAGK